MCVCSCPSYLSTNWSATPAKLMLSIILMWTCTNIRAYSWLFPHMISHSWPEECCYVHQSRKDAATFGTWWLVKVKRTLQPFLLWSLTNAIFKKLLFRHISGNFLIILLITISLLSLSSNKLGNNFYEGINLMMTMSSLLISNNKITYFAIVWLLIITFDVVRS